jgi:hypothetical protein
VPLFDQLPPTFICSAVPTLNVPAVFVKFPLNVNVVVLPLTESVRPVLFDVRLWNVCVDAVPVITWSAVVLVKLTVLDPGVNVPLFVQLPLFMSMRVAEPAANAPEVIVSEPFTLSVVVPASVTEALLAKTRLLKV